MPDRLDQHLGDAATRLTAEFQPEPPLISTLVRQRRNRHLTIGAMATVALLCVAMLALARVNRSETVNTITKPNEMGTWNTQALANPTEQATNPAQGIPTALGVTEERSVILMVALSGVMHSWVAGPDGRFRVGGATETGGNGFGEAGLVVIPHDGGWLAIGSGACEWNNPSGQGCTQHLTVFRSSDGSRWTNVATTGLENGGTAIDATTIDGAVVLVGNWRYDLKASTDPHHPVAWKSTDGTHWTETILPTPVAASNDSQVTSIAATDGSLVAIGQASSHNVVWTSRDRGDTWKQVTDGNASDLTPFAGLATDGHQLLASTTSASGPYRPLYRSTDDGRTWVDETTTTPELTSQLQAMSFPNLNVTGASGRLVAQGGPPQTTCNPAPAPCGSQFIVNTDGEHWTEVTSSPWPADQFAVTSGGRIVMVHFAKQVQIATWTGSTDTPSKPSTSKP